jgi:hypothetical protein
MPTRLSRSVLSSSHGADQLLAASAFLDAVCDMFPDRFAALETLGRSHLEDAEMRGSNSEDDDHFLVYGQPFGAAYDGLHERVYEWTSENGISCAAVDKAATLNAAGQQVPDVFFIEVERLDKSGNPLPEQPPSIQVWPFNETLEQFLERARRHYKEVLDWYGQRGFKKRPIKRESDHFRWLAAYLVGGRPWAQIAEDEDLNPLRLSEKTIAGEARKVALLIGIPLRNTPGPRRGSHHTPRRLRRR